MTTRFNEVVQADLLFAEDRCILHLIDEAIRWSVAVQINSRTTEDILEELHVRWVAIFGAPKVIITDQEGAFKSEVGVIFCQRNGIELKFTAIRQHPQIMNRRQEILRVLLKRIKAQCTQEGILVDFRLSLAEAVFAKNAMLEIGGETPYRALFGRSPSILPDFEEMSLAALEKELL